MHSLNWEDFLNKSFSINIPNSNMKIAIISEFFCHLEKKKYNEKQTTKLSHTSVTWKTTAQKLTWSTISKHIYWVDVDPLDKKKKYWFSHYCTINSQFHTFSLFYKSFQIRTCSFGGIAKCIMFPLKFTHSY